MAALNPIPPIIYGDKTPTLNLNKPDRVDNIYIDQLNENMNILDLTLNALSIELLSTVKLDSPVFIGVPEVPLANGENANQIVNVQYITDALEVQVL